MIRHVAVVVLGGLLLSAGACNVLTGVDDLGVMPGTSSSGETDGGSSGTSGTSGTSGASGASGASGTSGTSGTSGGVDGGDSGAPAPNFRLATCGNSQVCLPTTGGWSPLAYVAFGGAGSGGCPSSWPTRQDALKSGGGNCACNCAPAGGSCAGSVDTKSGAACAGPMTNLAVTAGACTDLSATLPLPVAVTPHLNGNPPSTCGAAVDDNLNRPNATVTTCAGATGTASTKCDVGELCFTKASMFGLLQTCLVHDGEVACPSKLNSRTVIGTAVTDGRSCGTTCACGPTSCSNGATLEAYSAAGCVSSVRTVNADGTCMTTGAAPSGLSYRYTAGTGCTVTTPATVLGSVTYVAPRTLCCSFGL